jgi:hypothetical protein
MFPSRQLVPQIHPIGVVDRRLWGLEIEKKSASMSDEAIGSACAANSQHGEPEEARRDDPSSFW